MDQAHEKVSEFDRRVAEVHRLTDAGELPWAFRAEPSTPLGSIPGIVADLDAGATMDLLVDCAGRVRAIRGHGKLMFFEVEDRSGRVQVLTSVNALGEDGYEAVKRIDFGDWVAVRGTVGKSKRGEPTLFADSLTLIGKALRQPPETWRGMRDPDLRYRRRYVDLLANESTREIFLARSRIISSIRRHLEERHFVEVETPILNSVATGAEARPFTTFHNALGMDLVLRIAPELYLKRLIVGGLERVFEVGRVFRNEGLSTRHNPEFTIMECYQAFADYHDMMDLCQALIVGAAHAANGHTVVTIGDSEIDLAEPWRRATMLELVEGVTGESVHPSRPVEEARSIAAAHGVEFEESWSTGKLLTVLFEELVEPSLVAPTFVLDHPKVTSPLARTHRVDEEFTERFELFIGGRELANAYSELIDPIEQRRRFEMQAKLREAGNDEAYELDEDYLLAMEYGMPPIGGMGIGIDRLVMVITGAQSIREVLLFPTLRPETGRPVPIDEVDEPTADSGG